MSALHIPSGGHAKTANLAIASSGSTAWSASFSFRVNAVPAAYSNVAFSVAGTNIRINSGDSTLHFYMTGDVDNIFLIHSYGIGQILHVVLSFNATSTSNIFLDGLPTISKSGLGAIAGGSAAPVGFALDAGVDISIGDFSLWSSHTISQADAAAITAGTSPLSLGTPPDGYNTLAGTSGTAAHAGDTGLANSAAGGIAYRIASVSANYSSDVLIGGNLVVCPEAFVSNRSGALILFWLASNFKSFSIVNDNGVYHLALLFVQMTSGGANYSSAVTATISGGSPTTPAVLGPPVVVGGQIVGVPIWDSGDGYAVSGASIAFTDSTGSGAVAVPIMGGQLLPVSSVGSPPVVKVNGSTATLNPMHFEGLGAAPFVAYQFQTPVTPLQPVTYTLPAAWATSSIGSSSASAANTVANNYAGAVHEPRFVLSPTRTMKQGFNHVPDPMGIGIYGSIGQDISYRFAPIRRTGCKRGGTTRSALARGSPAPPMANLRWRRDRPRSSRAGARARSLSPSSRGLPSSRSRSRPAAAAPDTLRRGPGSWWAAAAGGSIGHIRCVGRSHPVGVGDGRRIRILRRHLYVAI